MPPSTPDTQHIQPPGPLTVEIEGKRNGKEVDRGRQLERAPRMHNPLARSESLPQNFMAAIEVDARPMRREPRSRSSALHEDPTDPRAVLDDILLEPCPNLNDAHNNVSEVLEDLFELPTRESSTRSRPRAITCQNPAIVFRLPDQEETTRTHTPDKVFRESSSRSPEQILHSKLRVQAPTISIHLENPPVGSALDQGLPAGLSLPIEIIQQILYLLSPVDFNSARHTCRAWFSSSLEKSLLETMFRRGGWVSSIHSESRNFRFRRKNDATEEWLLSKLLSRECALGADWTGNGISGHNEAPSTTTIPGSPFCQTSTVDFTEVADQYPGSSSSGTVFTVSSCGRFLMTSNGCLIYIHEINRSHRSSDDASISHPGYLRPITSIICPRRVVACSMDTSSHRYAIAALLDGRMGLVCDIDPANVAPKQTASNHTAQASFNCSNVHADRGHNSESCGRPSFLDRVCLNSSATAYTSALDQFCSVPLEPPFVFPGIATLSPSTPLETNSPEAPLYELHDPIPSSGPNQQYPSLPRVHNFGPGSRMSSLLPVRQEGDFAGDSMPIETGPRSLYRNLCSEDDPPRSVAICPQRRCVAFGCSAGIELHWVDALTGQDLNRWFPLTAPSDYLYFLPPRKSVDSAKKLRLISSSAKPGERAAISQKAFGGCVKYSPFWDRSAIRRRVEDETGSNRNQGIMIRLRGEGGNRRVIGSRMVDCSDHYYAIPLSDGYHILFTDPATGLLCLGSDAPIGGPTKLLRKIWFQGPEGKGSPTAYAGGSDLTKGVTVVAAYGSGMEQSIWFFSVPPDVFQANQGPQTLVGGSWLRSSSVTESAKTEWMKWWPSDDGLQDWRSYTSEEVADILPKSVWPVKIRGQEIGTCSGLVDLTVDSGPDMTVWAFSKEGISTVWKLDDGKMSSVKTLRVMRDGSIREEDWDGDVEMIDSPGDIPQPSSSRFQESFDGASNTEPVESSQRSYQRDTGREIYNCGHDLGCRRHSHRIINTQRSSFHAVRLTRGQYTKIYRSAYPCSDSPECTCNSSVEYQEDLAMADIEIRC